MKSGLFDVLSPWKRFDFAHVRRCQQPSGSDHDSLDFRSSTELPEPSVGQSHFVCEFVQRLHFVDVHCFHAPIVTGLGIFDKITLVNCAAVGKNRKKRQL